MDYSEFQRAMIDAALADGMEACPDCNGSGCETCEGDGYVAPGVTCHGGGRHWYAYYGWVGSSSPVCVRCGAPNPNYRPDDDPRAGRR